MCFILVLILSRVHLGMWKGKRDNAHQGGTHEEAKAETQQRRDQKGG